MKQKQKDFESVGTIGDIVGYKIVEDNRIKRTIRLPKNMIEFLKKIK